jgi:hypothetical protein
VNKVQLCQWVGVRVECEACGSSEDLILWTSQQLPVAGFSSTVLCLVAPAALFAYAAVAQRTHSCQQLTLSCTVADTSFPSVCMVVLQVPGAQCASRLSLL